MQTKFIAALRHIGVTLAVAAVCLLPQINAQTSESTINLRGSGARFPHPVYVDWFRQFTHQDNDIFVHYGLSASTDGIRDFLGNTVDFAASDIAIEIDRLEGLKGGAVVLPVTAIQLVLIFNLPGIEALKLSRDAYANIFLGKVQTWDHPSITASNPEIQLPNTEITVVTHTESSGASYLFSGHLSNINDEFRENIGISQAPNWPRQPGFERAAGSQGVAAKVRATPGSIGFIDHCFAEVTNLPEALLENRSGNYIEANVESGTAALEEVEFPEGKLPGSNAPNLIAWVWDPAAEGAYPITSFSWLLLYAEQDDSKAKALRKMLSFILHANSQAKAGELGLVPLPEHVREKVLSAIDFVQ
ncbi:phosphate-binding protein PstS [Microbulbifer sp. NBRC 101763]|uniref:phosphate ABC transporter substrate-binding protein PstS n=1 Tax=Microbulbifer sp. NBRC 101763 TaxID=1113820 RepID=UPI0030B61661